MQTRIPGPWVEAVPFTLGKFIAAPMFQTHTIILVSLLLTVDVVFGALHLVWCCTDAGLSVFFSVDKDRGFAEIYQYVKAFWATALLAAVFLRVRAGIYLAWSAVMAYLLMDDALGLHERMGRAAVAQFNLQGCFGLRPTDYGELIVVGVVAVASLSLIALTHRRAPAPARAHSWRLLELLLLLGVFGVVFDLVHSMAGAGTLGALAALLEDGGEMVLMSLIAAYCFQLCCRAYDDRATGRAGSGSAAANTSM